MCRMKIKLDKSISWQLSKISKWSFEKNLCQICVEWPLWVIDRNHLFTKVECFPKCDLKRKCCPKYETQKTSLCWPKLKFWDFAVKMILTISDLFSLQHSSRTTEIIVSKPLFPEAQYVLLHLHVLLKSALDLFRVAIGPISCLSRLLFFDISRRHT